MSLITNRMTRRTLTLATAGTIALAPLSRLLAQDDETVYEEPESLGDLSGAFEADGSSTLGPLTEAAIEEFAALAPGVQITNGISGTGGGFERFAKGETVISNASRPIKPEEVEACNANGIDFYEFSVAYDGITVVVSAENDFVTELTVDELKTIWMDGGVTTWDQVRPEFPAEAIELYGPGTASGTYDYFNEAILGEDVAPRTDYTPSEDDNVLVEGVAGSEFALGYFGFSYYEENADSLKAVKVNGVEPTMESIADGSYAPLSRTLFIYVNANELQSRPEVQEFVKFYVSTADELAESAGYISLPEDEEKAAFEKVGKAIDGAIEPENASFLEPNASPATSPIASPVA